MAVNWLGQTPSCARRLLGTSPEAGQRRDYRPGWPCYDHCHKEALWFCRPWAAGLQRQQPGQQRAPTVCQGHRPPQAVTDLACHPRVHHSASTHPWSRQAYHRAATCPAALAPTGESPVSASAEAVEASGVQIRPAETLDELVQVAFLRAEAYYEEQPRSRYVKSFIKQFAEGEVRSLRMRTQAGANSPPECVCLVAVQHQPQGSSVVVGTLDLQLPASHACRHPSQVPPEDSEGAYVLNVVVAEGQRGQGTGKALLEEAARMAKQDWQAQRMYTHVAADNEVASRVYRQVGFHDAAENLGGNSSSYNGALKLGRQVLLQRDL